MSDQLKFDAPDKRLKRDIGTIGVSMLVLNGMIGAGIFGLPAVMANEMGDFSPWMFLIFGALMLTIVWSFAELTSYFRATGGPVLYNTEAFGPFVGFQAGWVYYVARVTSIGANANLLVIYLSALWPDIMTAGLRWTALIAICLALTVGNVVGVKRAIRALDGLTLLKILPLVGFVGYGLITFADSIPAPGTLPALDTVGGSALLILYAIVGFESAVVPAGEMRNPKRTLPRSLIYMVIATVLFYFVIQLAYMSVVGTGVAEGTPPMVEFGRILAGPAGAVILTLTAVFSIAANLMGSTLSTPRLTFALAREESLPGWFSHVSERYSTPDYSIIFFGSLACILALTGSFVWLAVVSTLARLIMYASSIGALFVIRKRLGEQSKKGVMVKLLRNGIPVIGIGVCFWAMAQASIESWKLLGALILLGTALFAIARHFARGAVVAGKDSK